MTVAFDSSVMASSRPAHPVTDFSASHSCLSKIWQHWDFRVTSSLWTKQNRLWICGGLQRVEAAGDHADAIQDHFHCQSCQDHCSVSLLCVCVWELWFIRIIHSQTRSFNPLEQFLQFRAWFGLFMQIMLHVPLVLDQVLYAYNKKKGR